MNDKRSRGDVSRREILTGAGVASLGALAAAAAPAAQSSGAAAKPGSDTITVAKKGV